MGIKTRNSQSGDNGAKKSRAIDIHSHVKPVPIIAGILATLFCILGYIWGLDSSAHNVVSLWLYCAGAISTTIALLCVFSNRAWRGVCVVLIIVCIALCWHLQHRWTQEDASKPQQQIAAIVAAPQALIEPPKQEAHSAPSTELTPAQVIAEVDNAMPYQQSNIRKSFWDAPVTWKLYLFAIDRPVDNSNKYLRIAFKDSATDWDSVLVEASLPIKGNEVLSMLPKGAPLLVRGQIYEVTTFDRIDLEKASVKVIDESESQTK